MHGRLEWTWLSSSPFRFFFCVTNQHGQITTVMFVGLHLWGSGGGEGTAAAEKGTAVLLYRLLPPALAVLPGQNLVQYSCLAAGIRSSKVRVDTQHARTEQTHTHEQAQQTERHTDSTTHKQDTTEQKTHTQTPHPGRRVALMPLGLRAQLAQS